MDLENEEDLLCSGCNALISKHVKFCSKCGTKNEHYEDYTQPVGVNYEGSYNDGNVVTDEIITYKKSAGKKGIKYAIIVGAIVLIGFLSVNVFGKTFFPDKYVKSAMLNTFNAINKNNKEFKDMPGIVSYLTQTDDVTENEVYVKFEGLGGDFDKYVSNMLDGYGLKLNLQNDLKNSLFNFNVGLFDGSSEIVSAQMYGSSDYMSLGIPALYDGHLGVTANSVIDETYNEYDEIKNSATILAKYYKAVNESKPVIKNKTENLVKEIISLAKFEKGSENNTYVANINGDEFLDVIEKYILEFINDENIKNVIFYSSYIENGYYSYEEAKTRFNELIEEVPVELKYYMNEIKLDNIEVAVTIGDKKLVKNFQMQTKLSNEYEEAIRLKTSGKIENTDNGIKSNYDFKITTEYDSFSIGASVENSKANKNLLNKIIKIDMDSSAEDTVSFEINEEYDASSKECRSSIDLIYDSSYEGEIPVLSLKSNGIFNGTDRIDFDNIDLILSEDSYYTYTLNLSGYVQNKDTKSINKVDNKNIKFINEMSEDELIDIMEDIESNIYLLSNEIF